MGSFNGPYAMRNNKKNVCLKFGKVSVNKYEYEISIWKKLAGNIEFH